MKRATFVVLLGLASMLTLSACASFHVRPPVPSRQIVVSGFEVVYGNQIPGDRLRLLDRYQVPGHMAAALRASYPAGQGPFVRVILTQFRSGRWGPTRMHAVVQVLDPAQNVLAQFDTDSTTIRGGDRGGRIQAVAQDIVNQVAAQL
ncbi:MAG: hypothetical protein RLO52_31660 [Sandaracinaceae bacterium]|nr:MAG: hypothetical protein EVA89_35920 [Sandaracinaceae bacterium]